MRYTFRDKIVRAYAQWALNMSTHSIHARKCNPHTHVHTHMQSQRQQVPLDS